MKTISILEAREMSGMPIPRIVGKVKMIWERKTGKNDNGDWSMQSGILTDGENEIKFTLSSFGEFPYKQGTRVIFRCKDGKKGLTGVKVKTDEYKGKNEPVLWVTPSAIVVSDSEESDDIPMDYPTEGHGMSKSDNMTATEARNASKANVAQKKAIPEGGVDEVQEVRKTLMQYANLRDLCDNAAFFLYPPNKNPDFITEEYKQKVKDVSSCFFIQGVRDGLHLKLPNNKPLSKKEDVEASEMEPEDIKF